MRSFRGRQFGYAVNGVKVSDFYTNHYFDPVVADGVRYSLTGAISEPRQVLRGGYLSWHEPISNHWWQETWFNSSAPTFRDIGTIDGSKGSFRSQIDRKSNENSTEAMRAHVQNASRQGLLAAAIAPTTVSKAAALRQKIDAILHHSTSKANPANQSAASTSPLRKVPRRRG